MLNYTEITPPMKIKATREDILYSIAQGVLLVQVRHTHDACRKVKLPMVLVPGLKGNLFANVAAARKSVNTGITSVDDYDPSFVITVLTLF